MTERVRSPAEMEAIKQAMMEELGIGRRDALPLEDRAANVPMVPLSSINRQVRPEHPASAWHNLNLDDVDPGLEDLDDIAGGQLYRLRRGGIGLTNSGRSGNSAGHGRGGASNRSDHASVGGRGNNSGSGQTYYNDARRGGKSHAKVDAGIALLQREAESSRKNRTEGRSFKTPQSTFKPTKPAHRAASPVVARAAPPLANRLINSRFKLTSPATFLSHNNIGSSPIATAPEPVVSATQNKVDDDLLVPSSASKLAPQGGLAASRWASPSASLVDMSGSDDHSRSATHANTASASASIPSVQQVVPAITTSASMSICSAQQIMPIVGANTSESDHSVRSVPPVMSTNASELTHSVQHATVAARLALITDDVMIRPTSVIVRTVMIEKSVKVCKNNSTFKFGIARLIKLDKKSPLTLEVQIENETILSDLLSEAAIFKVEVKDGITGSTVIYRANATTEKIPTWKLQFQLPGTAKSFVHYHSCKISELRRSGGSSPSSEQESQGPLVLLSPISSSAEKKMSDAEKSYLTNRISSSTFADLIEIDSEEILVPLHEEECKAEDDQVEEYSHFKDLLSLMEGDIVEGTLQVLNANHGGSFYDHVFHLAKNVGLENDAHFMKHAKNVFIGGLSSSRYSSSKPILSVTEELVSDFLTRSKTLLRFPQEFIDAYIKQIAQKILDMAQNFHNGAQSAAAIPTEKSSSVEAVELTEVSETVDVVKPVEPLQIVEATKSTEAISPIRASEPAAVTIDFIPKSKRVAYSIQEMLKMRPNATLTSEVLTARTCVEKYLPGHKLQYKNSPRATAPKIQPSEWKTHFSSKVNYEEVSQTLRQDEHAPGKTNFVASGAANPSESSVVKHETPISVSKSLSSAGNDIESIENDLTLSISAENNVIKPSVDAHQDNSDKSSGKCCITSQSATHNLSKSLSVVDKNKPEDKMDSGSGDSPPKLPSNRGLSTSRYARLDVINQAAVLRASSGYNPTARQVVTKQESLPPKPREASINAESSEVSKNEPKGLASTSETENSKSQETNPNTLAKVMENEMKVPKVVGQGTHRSKHAVTNSDVDRLVKVFSDLDVKAEKDNGTVVDISPAPERSTSPTVEEFLQKKRASGLSTSRWASQAPALKCSSRTGQSTPTTSYSNLTSSMPQGNRLSSPQSAVAITSSRPFPPRSNTLNGRPADTDSDDVLKATASVSTPSLQKNESTVNRPVLSPVRNRQNPQQEAIQARLNKSLASKRM
ncbi:hypothetical protein BHYA_0173g00220 [Botrytis hyacinthi]|uniref:Uncharacterized protein n=1 Tax=Botrytis hyacinthi TaxID=278943 RepID=A0A4Z1GFY2_9HELO|nr:hypothetical protein BHYA_0173g00220 [Botrytis hyacinthi]